MFTLVICLVVVALSGAAVLHITLVDQTKRATPKHRQPRDPGVEAEPAPISTLAPEVDQREAAGPPTEASSSPGPPPSAPEPRLREPSPPSVVIEANRVRSAGLLVLLLTTIGGVLAVAVAVVAVVAAIALRAALVG